MVFLLRETLVEEDKTAYLNAAKCWCESFRKSVKGQWERKLVCVWLTAINVSGMALISRDYGVWNLAGAWLLICLVGIWWMIWPWPPQPPVPFKTASAPELQDVPLRILFLGNGGFSIWTPTETIRLHYSSITGTWEDKGRFYLLFGDHPPLVLRKNGFAGGTPEEFRDFLERKLGFPVERID